MGPMCEDVREPRMTVMLELEIRPMVWDASVTAPSEMDDVTVILRVTYNTLEAICGDLFDVTETAPERRPN